MNKELEETLRKVRIMQAKVCSTISDKGNTIVNCGTHGDSPAIRVTLPPTHFTFWLCFTCWEELITPYVYKGLKTITHQCYECGKQSGRMYKCLLCKAYFCAEHLEKDYDCCADCMDNWEVKSGDKKDGTRGS